MGRGIRNASETGRLRQDLIKMRDVVLVDFGGTLDADGDRWAVRFHRAYAAAGGRLREAEFESLFRESDRQLEAEPAVRTMGFRAMIITQAELLGQLLPDGRAVDLGRVAERFHADALAIVNRNRPVLEHLVGRCCLGVVSNFTGNLDRCLAELDLLHLFAVIADSALVGWAKPDPRIFQSALDTLDTGAHDAWMIGDNLEADIRPAAALGMRTCWLAPPERQPPGGITPTARIARLTELPAAIAPCMD
jgi:FMN phosphatase YigB (HAD superfamily)